MVLYRSLLLAGASLAVVPAAAQTGSSASSSGIEDIVVTAQKREERLQDVPVAVSAVSSESIREQRIQSAIDLGTLVPSLNVTPALGGNQAIFIMRGSLAATASNYTVDGSISQYIDGVYQGPLAGTLFDVADIERIEVIRGPAGTLFGTNATGGAVNYITSRPKGQWYARQELSYSRFNSFRAKTRLDLPEWNGLSASFTYLHNYAGNNIRNGDVFTFDTSALTQRGTNRVTSARKLGVAKTDAFHGALRYQPVDGLTLDYYFDYSKRTDAGPGAQIVGFTDGPSGFAARDFLADAAAKVGRTLDDYVGQSRKTQLYATQTPGVNKVKVHNFSLEYDANDYLTIKNIASWRQLEQGLRINGLDGAGGLVNTDGSLSVMTNSALESTNNQFSNETQFVVDTEPFDLTAGLFYYTRHSRPGTNVQKVYSPSFLPPFFTPAFLANFPASTTPDSDFVVPGVFLPGETDTVFRTRQIAGYAQGTYHITPQIDITGGIRYTQDSKQILDGPTGDTFDYSKGKFTYLGNLSYKPNDDMLVYAKYATGFVAGGLTYISQLFTDPADGSQFAASVSTPYQEERAKSWELGLKADFFDKRLRTNLALFRVDYSNLQISFASPISVTAPSGQPAFGLNFGNIGNVGKARVTGVEYEITAAPVPGLVLSAVGAYNKFKYLVTDPRLGEPVLRPEFTANLSAEYELPIAGDMRLALRGDANYRSRVLTMTGFPYSEDPLVNPDGAAVNRAINQPGLWKLNARVSLKDVPLGPTKGQLSFWGRNLTNKTPVLAGGNLGTTIIGVFGDPVTYGVDLTVEF